MTKTSVNRRIPSSQPQNSMTVETVPSRISAVFKYDLFYPDQESWRDDVGTSEVAVAKRKSSFTQFSDKTKGQS
jgi:hypothetical protein